jgi:hypothetical protein
MCLNIAFLFGEILPQVLQVLSLSGTIMCALTICFFMPSTVILSKINAIKMSRKIEVRYFLNFTKVDICHIALSALVNSNEQCPCAVYNQHSKRNLFRRAHRLCGTNDYDFDVGDILTGYRL